MMAFFLCFLPFVSGRLLNLADLSPFQEVETQLLSFSPDAALLEYTFDAFGHRFHLELERNAGLLHPNYAEYTWTDGKLVENSHSTRPTNHCYYRGRVRGEVSSVAVSLCEGVKGLIQAYGENWVIHPHHLTTSRRTSYGTTRTKDAAYHYPHPLDHVLFPISASTQPAGKCGVAHDAMDFPGSLHLHSTQSQAYSFPPPQGRRLLQNTKSHQYVELLTVNDFERINYFGPLYEQDTLTLANIADSCYSNSNLNPPLSIVLVAQVSFTNGDPYSSVDAGNGQVNTNDLLNSFLAWAYNSITVLPSHDSHILVSGYQFQGSTVGLAPVGYMCDAQNSGAVVQTKGYGDPLDGATLAHEMGHTLSMLHDGSAYGNSCPSTGYVMQAVANANVAAATEFSNCSIASYENWVATVKSDCLLNIPTTRWGSGVCGNGIVETGEECDCGSDTTCSNDPCCNGPICRLKSGSQYQCSCSQPCCITQGANTCKFVPQSANLKCRSASADGCASDTYCSGISGACPTTGFAKPGTSCTDVYSAQGDCYNGICHTWRGRCRKTNPSYNECPQRQYDTTLAICVEQFCTTGSGCFAVNGTDPNTTFAEDGVPCDTAGNYQCLSGTCVPSSELYTNLNPNNPNNWGGIDPPIDVNKIVTYAAIALGIGLILSCFWRMCCNRQKRIVYVSRIRNRKQQVPVEGQPHAAPVQIQREIPAGREGQGAVDVGGGLVLEFGGRSGTAVLPPGWTSHYTSDGRPYWFNTQRGETSWTFPTM